MLPFAVMALAAALVLPFITVKLADRLLAKDWSKSLSSFQTLLSVTGILLAAVWYFVEQPSATKLKLDQSVAGWPVDGGRVLITVEVSMTNIGSTAQRLNQAPFDLYVQQVTPLPKVVEMEYQASVQLGRTRSVHGADNWASLAQIYGPIDPKTGRMLPPTIDSFLEAGETENLYYRVILPCIPALRVYVTSRLSRKATFIDRLYGRDLSWIKQTPLDLSAECTERGEFK